MPFGQERKSLKGEIPEEFSMSAVDMSMIDHIPDMIENGVDSLKIEGRMKSIPVSYTHLRLRKFLVFLLK